MAHQTWQRLFKAEAFRLLKLRGLYVTLGVAASLTLISAIVPGQPKYDHGIEAAITSATVVMLPLMVWCAQYAASHYESGSFRRIEFFAGSKSASLRLKAAIVAAATLAITLASFVISVLVEIALAVFEKETFKLTIENAWPDFAGLLIVIWFAYLGLFAGLITRNKTGATTGLLVLLLVPQTVLAVAAAKYAFYMPMALVAEFTAGPDAVLPGEPSYAIVCVALALALLAFAAGGTLRSLSRQTKPGKTQVA